MAFHPYLYFDGDCRQAMTHYQSVFGGELVIMDGTQAPPDAGIPADKMNLVMHASLVDGDDLLMASDAYESYTPATAMWVHYSTHDLDRAKAIFEGLSEGADIRVPGHEEFWTPFFGALVDRFGTPWQVSVEQEMPAG